MRRTSGDLCDHPGRWRYDGYSKPRYYSPPPLDEELEIEMKVGDTFPSISSCGRKCCWKRLRLC